MGGVQEKFVYVMLITEHNMDKKDTVVVLTFAVIIIFFAYLLLCK